MHVVQYFPGDVPPAAYGGIERVVFWLARELVRRKCKVTLIASPTSKITEICPEINFIPCIGATTDYRTLIPADADVVHLHHSPTEAELPDLPCIVTEHGNRKGGGQVRNTVFLSRSHAACHGSSHYVYNGIPKDEYPFCPDKEKKFLFLAKLGWRIKNAKTAINLAFDSNTRLALAGGNLFACRKIRGTWLLKWPFKKHLIDCVGEVGGSAKLRLLQESQLLFYLVNWSEPFALAPHEALACGTPVLASPNGALAEYVEHGRNGYMVRSYDEALAVFDQIKDISASEQRRMAEYCRESAFSIENCVDRYLEYYEKVIAGDLYSEAERAQLKFVRPPVVRIRKFLG